MPAVDNASEVFALTDEQIVGLGSEKTLGANGPGVTAIEERFLADARNDDRESGAGRMEREEGLVAAKIPLRIASGDDPGHAKNGREIPRFADSARNDVSAEGTSQADVPEWLAERMRDPMHGEAAKELWNGKQRAEAEIAAYREVFATAADARVLKELYPGGLAEAKTAAERARELEAIDLAFYRGDAGARTQLAQRMMQQDPAAFRAMVELGVRLLDGDASVGKKFTAEAQRSAEARGDSPQGLVNRGGANAEVLQDANGASFRMTDQSHGQARTAVAPEVVRAYGEFEKAANAELEKSVGGAIARVMEEALPNLRNSSATGREGALGTAPLRDRLATAVREEVETALRSDAQLGEQVARVLAGRRFDGSTRAQVVRLIDARAQQLVPTAVKRVVGSWTQATLGARGSKGRATETVAARSEVQSAPRPDRVAAIVRELESPRAVPSRGRRVDYRKISDEEILGM